MSYEHCPFCGGLAEQRFPDTHKCPGRAQGIAAATGRTPVWGPAPPCPSCAETTERLREALRERDSARGVSGQLRVERGEWVAGQAVLMGRLSATEADIRECREALRRIVWAHDETDGGDLTEAIDASRSLLVRLAPPTPESAP